MSTEFKIYDIISVTKFEKKNVQGNPVLILKEIKQEITNVEAEIGQPLDFSVNEHAKRI